MRILVDECVDPRVKRLFADHQSATVHEKQWDAFDDGALLAVAQDQFDVLLTIDRGIEFQQNIAKFRLGVVVIHVPKNQIGHYVAIQQEILLAVEDIRPGEVRHVPTSPNLGTQERGD
jgi:predicted nuclease of predicted toxin-antitoxin system